jgi:hypothetical protein
MAHLMSVEKSKFINDNINIYKDNKIGQYSKFLEKNPIFVTYYHINRALSRADVGTGGIENEVGRRSPIRFNKILNFPIYNIPELKPDVVYDETGYDIDLEMNDVTLLPNTIKPLPGDYVLIDFPGIKRYLFRVNQISYNTIQSNDFYIISMDVKYIDHDIDIEDIEYQVVEIYQTIFENIGTQDKCFLKLKDIDDINSIVDLFYTLRDLYKSSYYNSIINSFDYNTGEVTCNGKALHIYDPYLEAFINKSKIFYDENSTDALVLTPNDILDNRFDYIFSKTLYNTVLKRSVLELSIYEYCYTSQLEKVSSVYRYMDYDTYSVKLNISKVDIRKNKNYNSDNSEAQWYDLYPLERWIPTWVANRGNEYFSIDFLEQLKNGRLTSNNAFEKIIYNYIYHIRIPISKKEIYDLCDDMDNIMNFYYIPIVLYIITQYYNEYFHSEKAIDLP